jgi:hypothetical protein
LGIMLKKSTSYPSESSLAALFFHPRSSILFPCL